MGELWDGRQRQARALCAFGFRDTDNGSDVHRVNNTGDEIRAAALRDWRQQSNANLSYLGDATVISPCHETPWGIPLAVHPNLQQARHLRDKDERQRTEGQTKRASEPKKEAAGHRPARPRKTGRQQQEAAVLGPQTLPW